MCSNECEYTFKSFAYKAFTVTVRYAHTDLQGFCDPIYNPMRTFEANA